jgi:hypothetical protein
MGIKIPSGQRKGRNASGNVIGRNFKAASRKL